MEVDERIQRKLEAFLNRFAEKESKWIDIGNQKEVRALLKKISRRIPDAHLNDLAEAMFAVEMHKQAIGILKKLVKKNPKSKKALNDLGVVHARIGEVEKALEFYDLALKLDQKYEIVWFNKGKALFKIEDLKAARDCFKRTVTLNKNNVSAWNNLGLVSKFLGDIDEAVKCYDRALEINQDYMLQRRRVSQSAMRNWTAPRNYLLRT
jgi:tetratricopeptide (TPR) repeat protein